MRRYDCEILYRPDRPELRFLPEGPYACGAGRFSWVAIQHGPGECVGSLNLYDLATGTNEHFPLPGRPGFAFPTTHAGLFVVGMERAIGTFDTRTGVWSPLRADIDADVQGTIINDGIVIDGGLIFGCKDLQFAEKKAGLYLWRQADGSLHRLRSDQICSNGKALAVRNGRTILLDIDSPTKTVVAYDLDLAAATLGEPRVAIDLRDGEGLPDGMILTPDERSAIVAIYHPGEAPYGEARQISLETGKVEAVWRTPGSPQVTCPQLVAWQGKVALVLTTAVENMPADRQARHPHAGCLFVGETPFDRVPPQPALQI